MKWLRRAATLGLALAALLVLSLVISRVADRGRFAGAYSTLGSGPRGTRALYLVLEQLGVRVQRWSQDLARLPTDAVLVSLGGCATSNERPLSRYEREELTSWVNEGGVLVVAGARHYLPTELGVSFAPQARCAPGWKFLSMGEAGEDEPEVEHDARDDEVVDETFSPEDLLVPDAGAADGTPSDGGQHDASVGTPSDGGLAADGGSADFGAIFGAQQTSPTGPRWSLPVSAALAGMSMVPLRAPGSIVVQEGKAYDMLLGIPREAPSQSNDAMSDQDEFEAMGVAVRHGRGHVIVLASASVFENAEVRESQGAVLLSRVLSAYAPGDAVLFDEYHLGVGERRSLMRYLREVGAAKLALLVAFIVLLSLWRAGARFGALHSSAPPIPQGTASFVSAMGQLYASVHDDAGATAILVRRACARIATHHHVPFGSSIKLERALRERGAHAAADSVRELAAVLKNADKRSLVERAARIDRACARALASGPAT
jgi:hypothetical protein